MFQYGTLKTCKKKIVLYNKIVSVKIGNMYPSSDFLVRG